MFFKHTRQFPGRGAGETMESRISGSKLRVLKADITAGSYQVPVSDVAEKMVSYQLFLFSHRC